MTHPKKDDGVDFEKLVERLLEAIDSNPRHTRTNHDVKIEGSDGKRQVDVLIESEVPANPSRRLSSARTGTKAST